MGHMDGEREQTDSVVSCGQLVAERFPLQPLEHVINRLFSLLQRVLLRIGEGPHRALHLCGANDLEYCHAHYRGPATAEQGAAGGRSASELKLDRTLDPSPEPCLFRTRGWAGERVYIRSSGRMGGRAGSVSRHKRKMRLR